MLLNGFTEEGRAERKEFHLENGVTPFGSLDLEDTKSFERFREEITQNHL
jgi:hypothetical protein